MNVNDIKNKNLKKFKKKERKKKEKTTVHNIATKKIFYHAMGCAHMVMV